MAEGLEFRFIFSDESPAQSSPAQAPSGHSPAPRAPEPQPGAISQAVAESRRSAPSAPRERQPSQSRESDSLKPVQSPNAVQGIAVQAAKDLIGGLGSAPVFGQFFGAVSGITLPLIAAGQAMKSLERAIDKDREAAERIEKASQRHAAQATVAKVAATIDRTVADKPKTEKPAPSSIQPGAFVDKPKPPPTPPPLPQRPAPVVPTGIPIANPLPPGTQQLMPGFFAESRSVLPIARALQPGDQRMLPGMEAQVKAVKTQPGAFAMAPPGSVQLATNPTGPPPLPSRPPPLPAQAAPSIAGPSAGQIARSLAGSGSAASGGAAAGAGAMAGLATIGIAAGAVVAALGAVAMGAAALDSKFREMAEGIRPFSAAMAAASARQQAMDVGFQLERSQRVGSELAGFTDQRGELGRELGELLDRVMKPILELVTPMLELLTKLIDAVNGPIIEEAIRGLLLPMKLAVEGLLAIAELFAPPNPDAAQLPDNLVLRNFLGIAGAGNVPQFNQPRARVPQPFAPPAPWPIPGLAP